ncbi:hypothetical protein AC578_7227 [Pseudocercospora eumusae]|uniref:Oxidoreductase molybdopterin-binding domain-containing protein n=1 Tax=Pseudocercospora eumusae TaxID=321146 RepID=A0A139HX00_9PEZI|nr:hypothetical protein AC578_7227 [Pseudocercospora eumusae]
MDDIKWKFDALNMPIFMACDDSGRYVFWKRPRVRDAFLASGISEHVDGGEKRYFIHFRGSDVHNEDHYETSLPLEYVMDLTNDVLLAHEMNDVHLPPDHGCWISKKEKQSYLHVWEVEFFLKDMDSELANYFFHYPDTACYEEHLNSVIEVLRQGDKIDLEDVKKSKEYHIEGFAYNNRGDMHRGFSR